MERNTILAIVLSISVLFTYDVFVAGPARVKAIKEAKLLKTSENKEVASQNTSSSSIPPEIIAKTNQYVNSTTNPSLITKKLDISNKNITVFGSNVGGSLHNIKFVSAKHPMPVFDILSIDGFDDAEFTVVESTEKSIIYKSKISSLEILKSYTVLDNSIKLRMEILNRASDNQSLLKFCALQIDSARMDMTNKRETMLDEYSVNVAGKIHRKGSAFKFEKKESKTFEGSVKWVNFRDHYHALAVKPLFETKDAEIKQFSENRLGLYISPAKQQNVYEFIVYAGPQDKAAMTKVNDDFNSVLAFSSFLPIEWLSQAIYHLTLWLQMVIKSWGVCIILISLLVYGMTYPLTIKSMMSMRRMQQMQPKINALRDRFKDDPQKLNMEIVEIYKREKINPFGGCLPMLLQMPFFMAIYQVMWRAYYFQGKSFLWISDLSLPDRIWIMPFSLPFLGNEFNILPILMGGVMFWQQKLSAQSMTITDETQAMQQKIMTTVFPVFITFIFYKFASSLALYFMMFYLLSALTQWRMSKAK